MKKINYLLILPLVLGIFSCTQEKKTPPPAPPSPQQAGEIRTAIINYMECEECTDGELEKLIKQGDIILPSLEAILKEGASPAKRTAYEYHLRSTYQELQEYQKTHPTTKSTLSENDYVALYMDNYTALYQSRAAHALGAFGGKQAKEILSNVDKSKVRDDVKNAIDESILKIK
ncbi:MAG TPA: hypothetical protein VJY62_00745 [Bacteroidia bacterium]|nr:hypothetical protein [Bacteroidia bacterium]